MAVKRKKPSEPKKIAKGTGVERAQAVAPQGANGAGSAMPARGGARGSLEGGLISITLDGVLGWLWDPADPTRAANAVIANGDDVVGTGVADLFDHDLVRRVVGPGIPGFLIKPTKAITGGFPVALTLRDEAGRTLGAPLVVTDPTQVEPFLYDLERGLYEGYIDQLRDGLLIGWAWSPSSPDRPVVVELYEGNDRIDRTVASIYREDLSAAGKRGGNCGFRLELPVSLLDDRIHSLRVKIADSQFEVPGGSVTFGPMTATSLITEIVALRSEVSRLTALVNRVASPQGELQTNLIRTLSERFAAVMEVQRETVERELDCLRALAFGTASGETSYPVPQALSDPHSSGAVEATEPVSARKKKAGSFS